MKKLMFIILLAIVAVGCEKSEINPFTNTEWINSETDDVTKIHFISDQSFKFVVTNEDGKITFNAYGEYFYRDGVATMLFSKASLANYQAEIIDSKLTVINLSTHNSDVYERKN